jgi:hypothetical protein
VVDVLYERRVYVRRGEDEDLGDGDGVKPAFDPAPNRGEEAGCTYDLQCVLVFCSFMP